jgi:hypothetical protein
VTKEKWKMSIKENTENLEMFAHHSDRMAKRRLIHPKANEKSTKPKGDLGAA